MLPTLLEGYRSGPNRKVGIDQCSRLGCSRVQSLAAKLFGSIKETLCEFLPNHQISVPVTTFSRKINTGNLASKNPAQVICQTFVALPVPAFIGNEMCVARSSEAHETLFGVLWFTAWLCQEHLLSMFRGLKFMLYRCCCSTVGQRGQVLVKHCDSDCEPTTGQYTTNSGSNEDWAKMTSVLEGFGNWSSMAIVWHVNSLRILKLHVYIWFYVSAKKWRPSMYVVCGSFDIVHHFYWARPGRQNQARDSGAMASQLGLAEPGEHHHLCTMDLISPLLAAEFILSAREKDGYMIHISVSWADSARLVDSIDSCTLSAKCEFTRPQASG